MPFETTLVMAVCAPDCGQGFVVCETFISSVTEVLREGRPVRQFYIASDVNEICGVLLLAKVQDRSWWFGRN